MSNKLRITTAEKANLRFAAPKHPDNVKFCALMERLKVREFRPAEVARKLNKSKAAVSQYLSGHTRPSKTVLELMRRIVEDLDWPISNVPDVIGILSKKLKYLSISSPSEYQLIKERIESCYENLPEKIKLLERIERPPGREMSKSEYKKHWQEAQRRMRASSPNAETAKASDVRVPVETSSES